MPVHLTTNSHNLPGFQWGNHGKIYTFKRGSNISMKIAYDKAMRQGRAVEINKKK